MTSLDPTIVQAGSTDSKMLADSVDRQLAGWRAKQPALDFSSLDVVLRLGRLQRHLDIGLNTVFARHGLSGPDFAVLATLVRMEEHGGVSQRRLMDELALTAGTISVRIDRLEAQGLVKRGDDATDRRNTFIQLTSSGKALFERVAPEHLANLRRILVALDDAEQRQISGLMAKLLIEFEGSVPHDGEPVLGLLLAPAHAAIEMCAAVGMPAKAGLLVRSVIDNGAAAQAGVLVGDLLVGAACRELRAVSDLYESLHEAAPRGSLRLDLLRGGEAMTVVVPAEGLDRLRGVSRGRTGHFEHLV